ncbi:MAG: guanylate kinase [Wenzhouxiangellaceae bacterium]
MIVDDGSNLFVIAAPSGAGKTSLVHALLEQDERLRLSISSTTRPPRPGEIDGQHYHFVSVEEFQAALAAGEFLEHAEVFGNFYGSRRQHVDRLQQQGYDVILEIDWQGAAQIRQQHHVCRSIFVLPPSLETLRQRLQKRGQDQPEIIARRMRDARNEISHYGEFDYLVINDQFDQALADLRSIIHAQRLRQAAQQRLHAGLLRDLLDHPGND